MTIPEHLIEVVKIALTDNCPCVTDSCIHHDILAQVRDWKLDQLRAHEVHAAAWYAMSNQTTPPFVREKVTLICADNHRLRTEVATLTKQLENVNASLCHALRNENRLTDQLERGLHDDD